MPRPTVGDSGWMVEWVEELAFYPDDPDTVDHDRITEHERFFRTREKAEAFAREVWPKTTNAFGVVSYWPVEFVAYDDDDAARYPHVGYWDSTADSEHYEGPDEI